MSGRAPLRIGTRGSRLALWQAERVRQWLEAAGHRTLLVAIRTTGDDNPDVPIERLGSRALFTKEIDDAVLDGRVDLAVHSLKDLPTTLPAGLALAAVSVREDPRDALIGRGPLRWSDLPVGAVIATSSPRRRAQLLLARGDLVVADLRGNVETRIERLDATPAWSAIVLAVAGLVRLGLADRIGERLPPQLLLPAPGQGALGVTARNDDGDIRSILVHAVHDASTGRCVAAERAFLRHLEGGCQVPVAALATATDTDRIQLSGRVVSGAGDRAIDDTIVSPARSDAEAEAVGVELARRLVASGAEALLHDARNAEA